MSVTTKTRRRMPWRKVGHDIYTDDVARELLALPDGIGAAALALRVLLEVRSVLDEAHLVAGAPALDVGWLLTEAGRSVTVGALAGTTGFSVSVVSAALEQLVEVGVAVRSDAGAWGTLGWASRQEDESAERKRQQRERDARRDSGGTASDKSVTSRGQSAETQEEDGDDERKTEDREPESRAAAAFRLVTTLADLHPPTADTSQRWKPKNRAHLAAAEALLGLDGDPGWPDEVIDIVTDFSAICAQNREEARFWLAPRMLAIEPAPKSTSGKSAWDTIRSVVASWRAEQRTQEREAHQQREQARVAERKRVADRLAELESLARNGEPEFARKLRESGQRSVPVVDHHACLSAAQEAIADARRGGRDPTLEEIEGAVRAVQDRPR